MFFCACMAFLTLSESRGSSKMGRVYLLICKRIGPDLTLFCLLCLCHTDRAFELDATKFLGGMHLGSLLCSFLVLSHCSKTSDYSISSVSNLHSSQILNIPCCCLCKAVSRFLANFRIASMRCKCLAFFRRSTVIGKVVRRLKGI